MNRAIFKTKSGKEISKRLDYGDWRANLLEAETILDNTTSYIEFRLMGKHFSHWPEEVITTRVKNNAVDSSK